MAPRTKASKHDRTKRGEPRSRLTFHVQGKAKEESMQRVVCTRFATPCLNHFEWRKLRKQSSNAYEFCTQEHARVPRNPLIRSFQVECHRDISSWKELHRVQRRKAKYSRDPQVPGMEGYILKDGATRRSIMLLEMDGSWGILSIAMCLWELSMPHYKFQSDCDNIT